MSDSFNNVLIRFSLATIPTTQFFVNDRDPSARSRILCRTFLMITGLNTFSYAVSKPVHHPLITPHLKLAIGAGNADGGLVPDHLCCNHGQGFALCRVDLARHDTTTRLVFGKTKFPKATTRARA